MARGGSGGVRVRIEAETSGLRAGVDQASGILHGFEQGSSRAARGARFFAEAISGITGAAGGASGAVATLLGGFAVGGVAGAAIGGVHALVAAITDIRDESAKAAREAAEHAAEIGKKMGEAALAVQRARFVAAGGNAADFDRMAGALRDEAEASAELTRRTTEHSEALARVAAQRAVLADPRMASPYATDMRAAAERDLAAFVAVEQQRAEAVRQAEQWIANIRQGVSLQVERTTAEATERATGAARDRWDAENRYIEQADAHVRAYYAHQEQMMRDLAAGVGSSGFEEEGARSAELYALRLQDATTAQAEYDRALQQTTASYEQWSDAAASAVSSVITGQATATEALEALGKSVLQAIIQMLFQKAAAAVAAHVIERPVKIAEVTSAAGVAGAEGAAAVAGIPVVGPAMAAAVAAALPAEIMAVTVPLASAAGGMMVPRDMLAMIHEDERVLPARYSEGLDRLVEDARRGGRKATTVNNYYAIDMESFSKHVRDAQRQNVRDRRKP